MLEDKILVWQFNRGDTVSLCRIWDEKQIVQFRRIDGRESCVLYGPCGIPSEEKC